MFVGVARIVISIPGARSLKDRRHVVKGLKDRIRARLPVSVAEVGELDRHQVAVLGISVASNDAGRAADLLAQAVKMARGARDAVLSDVRSEVLPFGHGGQGIKGGIEGALDGWEALPHDEDEDD